MIDSKHIAVLVKRFPKVSETFILQELLALQERGVPLVIYSLYRPSDKEIHDATVRLTAVVHYTPALKSLGSWLRVYWYVLRDAPLRYTQAMLACAFSRKRGRVWDLFAACYFAARARKDSVNHIHAHFANMPTAVAGLIKMLAGIPYSVSAHAKDIYLTSPGVLRKRLLNAEFTITCTEYNREYLARLLGDDRQILRSHHGIDTDFFSPPQRVKSGRMILSIGRFQEKKGFATLIEACRRLVDLDVEFECRIVGYGPLQSMIEERIVDCGLESHVKLTGKLSHQDVFELYSQATIFALPCQIAGNGDRDGIPNVLLEAMAMELAVVTTPVSGIPELVRDGNNGLLVLEKDPETLAKAVMRLFGDTELAQRLGKAARQTVIHNFKNATNTNALVKLLESRLYPGDTVFDADEQPLTRKLESDP